MACLRSSSVHRFMVWIVEQQDSAASDSSPGLPCQLQAGSGSAPPHIRVVTRMYPVIAGLPGCATMAPIHRYLIVDTLCLMPSRRATELCTLPTCTCFAAAFRLLACWLLGWAGLGWAGLVGVCVCVVLANVARRSRYVGTLPPTS